MNINIDWNKVIDVEYHIEGDGIWSISVAFDNGQACTYGYTNMKDYLRDCTEIACKTKKGQIWEDL